MMAAVAQGKSTVTGLLEGEDVLNTAKAVRALGAGVERTGPGAWTIEGVGTKGFSTPAGDLDFGNSGTGARLMMGLVGGHDVSARFVGDASLSSRPMERVLKPLREMGVTADTAPGGRLPAIIRGGNLKAVSYTHLPISSTGMSSSARRGASEVRVLVSLSCAISTGLPRSRSIARMTSTTAGSCWWDGWTN